MVRYLAPVELQDALRSLASAPARILAGGTDFYPALRDRPVSFDTMDISRIAGLRGIAATADGWRIGATTTWTDIVRAPLPRCFDGLKLAALEVGSVQIQNAGTVAGNLCNASPAADGVPPLLSLGAEVEASSVNGVRRLPLADFIAGVRRTALRPDEMVTAIHIPAQPGSARGGFRKLGSRAYLVISIAMVAAVLAVDAQNKVSNASIAVGSCSPVACRLPALERALLGVACTPAALAACVRREHLAPLSPIDDIRGSGGYRTDAVEELLRRVLADCCGDQML